MWLNARVLFSSGLSSAQPDRLATRVEYPDVGYQSDAEVASAAPAARHVKCHVASDTSRDMSRVFCELNFCQFTCVNTQMVLK